MKAALAAHSNRDYSRAEALTLKLISSGKVPANAKERVNHFLDSIQTLKKSIEYDLKFTEGLLKKGNYLLANIELPQLKMVVSPNNPRLKAIIRTMESKKVKAHLASTMAKVNKENQAIYDRRKANKKSVPHNFKELLSRLTTLVKDGNTYNGPKSGRRLVGRYPIYSKTNLSRWRMYAVRSEADAPKGWYKRSFTDIKWPVITLPTKTNKKSRVKNDHILLRTHFEVKDKSAFNYLLIRLRTRWLSHMTVYLNGKIVAKGDIIPWEGALTLKPSSRALLKKGKNTLAIMACRTRGPKGSTFSLRLEGYQNKSK